MGEILELNNFSSRSRHTCAAKYKNHFTAAHLLRVIVLYADFRSYINCSINVFDLLYKSQGYEYRRR